MSDLKKSLLPFSLVMLAVVLMLILQACRRTNTSTTSPLASTAAPSATSERPIPTTPHAGEAEDLAQTDLTAAPTLPIPTSPLLVPGESTPPPSTPAQGVTPPTSSTGPISIFSFDIFPSEVEPGEPITLTWNSVAERVVIHKLDYKGRLLEPAFDVALSGTLVITDYQQQGNRTAFTLSACSGGACDTAMVSAQVICRTEWFFSGPPAECPTPPSHTTVVAQHFEGGLMLWLEAADWRVLDEILILYDDDAPAGRRWEMMADKWDPSMPEEGPDIVPPAGYYEPVRGFGQVWREVSGVRERLGWATDEEFVVGSGTFQCARGGYGRCYLSGPNDAVYVLEPEMSGWFVWPAPPTTLATPTPGQSAPAPEPPVILSFTAYPIEVDPGGSVLLTWESSGGVEATIQQGLPGSLLGESLAVPTIGSIIANIKEEERLWHEFRLIVRNDAGQAAERSLTIQIRCPYEYFFAPPPDSAFERSCPHKPAAYTPAAEQLFERGRMIWLQEIPQESAAWGVAQGPTIYVLYNNYVNGEITGGQVQEFDDTWTSAEPESDPSILPPEGLYQPVRGFGKVWRNHPDVRERLGWALAPEQGFDGAYQVDWRPYYQVGARYLRTTDGSVIWLGVLGNWGFLQLTPWLTPTPSIPTPQPVASLSGLVEPLLIDGEKGWMFASAAVDGKPKTVKLATQDGRLLAAYDVVGRLALDRAGNRLVVDQGEAGVAILDAETGTLQAALALPIVGPSEVDPQVDPTLGLAYVFRDRTIYLIDPAAAAVVQAVTLSIPSTVCGDPWEDAPVARSFYDLVNHKLYLGFVTYVCTPWVHQTLVAYDATTLTELGRYQTELRYQAMPFLDSLYGTTAGRLGRNVAWAWNGREAWHEEGYDGSVRLQGIVADWGRQLVYEALDGRIKVLEAYPRAAMDQVEMALLAGEGRLAGHDPISDQLYFLVEGRLEVRPTSAILSPPSP